MKRRDHTKKIWKEVSSMNIQHSFTLGPINAESLLKDPKHLSFTLSRYKFAAKMMKRCKHIIEIGCGEGIGALMFLAETSAKVTAVDFDKSQIEYARRNVMPHANGRVEFICQDMISRAYEGAKGDGLVCIDVIEHIHPSKEGEGRFFANIVDSLKDGGIALFGTPNKHASKYASVRSKKGHINLFDHERLISTLEKYFRHVFLFSMNDEMVHTGYEKLAHYLIALCIK